MEQLHFTCKGAKMTRTLEYFPSYTQYWVLMGPLPHNGLAKGPGVPLSKGKDHIILQHIKAFTTGLEIVEALKSSLS